MYVNERDQINYHGFLRALREMNHVSQECVSKGICTVSGMNRFENGNRIAEKLMRDRLTARLGISGEKYEDYLQPKEYVRWEHRLRIVKAIEKKDDTLAKKELMAYEELPGLNCVNKQFVETMRFMILSSENASKEELLECVQKAIKCTVPNVKKALMGAHLLSDQEINLIAEELRLSSAKAPVKDAKAWRIAEYEKLISYMDNSCWEKLQKAKVYPKVVWYISQLLLEETPTEVECRRGLELCHNAIELLRDTSRLYYFIELTEMRRTLAERLISYGIELAEQTSLEEMLNENNTWETVFKELYAEYNVAPYMSDFCYLYYETECHNMVEVIETRRKMLGLSRVKLGEGLCTERTIIRFEREGKNPSIDLVRLLFEKMGLCAEYRRAQIIVPDGESLLMYVDLVNNLYGLKYDYVEQRICQIQDRINMNIIYNRQEISRISNLVKYRSGRISKEMLTESARESFQSTISVDVIERCIKEKHGYLTRAEIGCVYDMGFNGEGTLSTTCRQYLKWMSEEYMKYHQIAVLPIVEFLLTRYASEVGDEGKYRESCEISLFVVKECLSHRRMFYVAENIYNIEWNLSQIQLFSEEIRNDMLEQIKKCICISQVKKDVQWETFFQTKYAEIIN